MNTNTDAPITDQPPTKLERPAPASIAAANSLPKSIPVKLLVLAKPRNVPGEEGASNVKCNPKAASNEKRWTVLLIPALRSFEITFFPPDQRKPVEVMYVHETHVDSWTPL